MKVIILAGGYGSRLENITEVIPKPMVPIEGSPILWHVMKIYSNYGFNDFVIALGYKGEVIKNYFCSYEMISSNLTVNLRDNSIEFHENKEKENWRVTLVDTGLNTLKGGRIKRIESYLDSQTNMLSYGDGLADIKINELIEFHNSHNKILTITGVNPPSHFGEIYEENNQIISFREKSKSSQGLINGGYMVFEKELFNYLDNKENCEFEIGALDKLVKDEQVMVYKHKGRWACMDSKRDMEYLKELWKNNNAFWKVWE